MTRMYRAGGSPPMLRVRTDTDGVTECVYVDGAGVIRRRFHPEESLTPLWLSLSPKTTWPEMGNLDLIEIEREQRQAAAARKAEKKTSRKAKRSLKLRRAAGAAGA